MINKVRWKFIAITMAAVVSLLLVICLVSNIVNFAAVTSSADQMLDYIAENGGLYPQDMVPPEPPSDSTSSGTSSDTSSSSSSSVAESSATGEETIDDYTLVLEGTSATTTTDTTTTDSATTPDGTHVPDGTHDPNNPGGGPGGLEGYSTTRYFTVTFDSTGSIIDTNVAHITAFDTTSASALATEIYNSGNTRGYERRVYRYLMTTIDNSNTLVIVLDYSSQLQPTYNFLWISLIVISVGVLIAFVIVFFLSKLVVKPLLESDRKQKQFITDAGHEMKTPLTIISANNEILEMEYGSNESTQTISKEVVRMTEMVKNLTSLAKIDEMEKPVLTTFCLTDTIDDAVNTFSTTFQKKGKDLRLDIDEKVMVKADESMIQKMLSIFFDNALKYSLTYTQVTLKAEGNHPVFEISNDADSIKNGNLNKVFERFYRTDEARGSSIQGSGIGLSIAKQIADNNHLKISAFGTDEKVFHIRVIF